MLRRVPVVAEWWEDAIIYISRQIQLLSNVPVVTVASRTFAMRCSVAKKGSVATLLSGLSTAIGSHVIRLVRFRCFVHLLGINVSS